MKIHELVESGHERQEVLEGVELTEVRNSLILPSHQHAVGEVRAIFLSSIVTAVKLLGEKYESNLKFN